MSHRRLNDRQFYFMGVPPRELVLEHLGISKEQDDLMQDFYSKDNCTINKRGEVINVSHKKERERQYAEWHRNGMIGFFEMDMSKLKSIEHVKPTDL